MIDAVSKGVYEKSMSRYQWTVEEVIAKWTLDKKYNQMWAIYMLENMLGETEARELVPEVFA